MPRDPSPKLTPGTLTDLVGYRLRVAQIAAFRHFEGQLRQYGIAPRYLGLLCIIGEHPGQPQSRLAEAVALQRSSLVPIIDQLEAETLVERRPAPGDARLKSVWLTAKGQQVVDTLRQRARAEEDMLTAGMNKAERALLARLLGQVVENLSRCGR